jgi:transcriptional regulator NrdR family protein
MIVCPKCGCDTAVQETRPAAVGTRRRRICVDKACQGRVTTYEMPVYGEIQGRR